MPGIGVFAAGPVEAGALGIVEPGDRRALSPYTLAIFALARHLCPPASHSRVAPAGRRAWFGGIFNGAEADFSMKVTVERAELLKSLGHVHRVVERRNTIPILANVLVKADRGKLSLKATDLDLEVIDSIAAEVSPGGSTTVPGPHVLRNRAQAARRRADHAGGLRGPGRPFVARGTFTLYACKHCRKVISRISRRAT